MPNKSLLATFVHVSDLHFGTLVQDPHTGEWSPDAPTSKLWAMHGIFDGLLGHHYRALDALQSFFRELRKTEQAQLIMTGDMTSHGEAVQFDTANEFLVSQIEFPPGSGYRNFGLFDKGWLGRAIPGNHDHWPGKLVVIGGPTQALGTYFPKHCQSPRVFDIPLGGTGLRLRLVQIDTDADVGACSTTRVFARGSFTSQLEPAANKLGAPTENEVRVLLLHHSRMWPNYRLGMDPASHHALDAFLADQNIRVVLTGHTHIPGFKVFKPQTDAPDILEARCGTTTVRDIIPYAWTTWLGGPVKRKLPKNSLLVHRLVEEQGKLWWEAETYTRTAKGFRTLGPVGTQNLQVLP